MVGHPLDPKGERQVWVAKGISISKSRPYKAKKNGQTLSKQLQNNFENVQKMTFSTPTIAKNDTSNRPKWAIFWPKTAIIGVIYRPFELKIHPKVGLFRSKTMPKNFLNNSKTTLRKSRNRLFWPPKLPKMTPQIGQNEHILYRKSWFLGSFIDLWSWKYNQK